MTHLCLARPEEGRSAPGDQFDCPECRVVLLDAFRDPAPVPEPRITSTPGARFPHLIMGDSGRTVDLGTPPAAPCAPVWGTHPEPNRSGGGIWRVVCNCGWRKEGRYGLNARLRAEQVAREWAQVHREDRDAHTTQVRVDAFSFQPGGWYLAECSCGWQSRGLWDRHQGEAWARGQAEAAAEYHRKHPEEGEDA